MDAKHETPLDTVKSALGGNVGIARALGNITSQAVSQWSQVPVERALEIEAKCGISRHVSRPDIFGPAVITPSGDVA